MRVQLAPKADCPWLFNKLRHQPASDFVALEAVDSSGTIRGMVGYEAWTPKSARAYLAMETPVVLRKLLVPAFWFPFVDKALDVLTLSIPAYSARNLALAKRLGFSEVYRVRGGWDTGIDMILFEMRRESCRWIQPRELRRAG